MSRLRGMARLVLCALSLLLGACDGHLVTLNIREPSGANRSALRHALYSCAGRDVLESVRIVAVSLNLIDETAGIVQKNGHEWHSQDWKFRLRLDSQGGGSWKVAFMDWPDSSRSELSSRAEADIKKSLTGKCVPL